MDVLPHARDDAPRRKNPRMITTIMTSGPIGAHVLSSCISCIVIVSIILVYTFTFGTPTARSISECPHISCALKDGISQYRIGLAASILIGGLFLAVEAFYPFPVHPCLRWKTLLITCAVLLTLFIIFTTMYKIGQGRDKLHGLRCGCGRAASQVHRFARGSRCLQELALSAGRLRLLEGAGDGSEAAKQEAKEETP